MDFLTKTRTKLTRTLRILNKSLSTAIFTIQLPNPPWIRLAPRQSVADIERDVEDRYLPPIVPSTPTITSPSDTDTESTLSETSSPSLYPLSTPATWPATPQDETPPATPASTPSIIPTTDNFDMAEVNSMYFTGKPEDEDPQDFMNRLERAIILKANISDLDQVKLLQLSLKAKSPAASWWATLTPADKVSFSAVRTAFEVRWPIKAVTNKTPAEKQALLDATILKPTDLGRRISASAGGEEELTHVVWADKVERLANDIPDTNNLLVSGVRKNLPKALVKIVGLKPMTWKAFCDAVRAVSHEELMAKVEEERDLARYALGAAAPNTPSKALGSALQNLNLAPQPPRVASVTSYQSSRPQPMQRTPYGGGGGYVERPLHERLADILSKALPLQPNNSEGVARYKLQISEWESTYGRFGKTPSETRPYPLTPGASPVASGECWKCGHRAHFPAACSTPQVPAFEEKWRSIAGSVRRKAEAVGTTAVNVHAVGVESDEIQTYEADDLAHLQFLIDQGKAGGPST